MGVSSHQRRLADGSEGARKHLELIRSKEVVVNRFTNQFADGPVVERGLSQRAQNVLEVRKSGQSVRPT